MTSFTFQLTLTAKPIWDMPSLTWWTRSFGSGPGARFFLIEDHSGVLFKLSLRLGLGFLFRIDFSGCVWGGETGFHCQELGTDVVLVRRITGKISLV